MERTSHDFKNYLKRKISENPKTSWGRNQLFLFIEETYSEFVEENLKSKEGE